MAVAGLALWCFAWRSRSRGQVKGQWNIDESERRFRDTFDLDLVGIVRTSIDGQRILAANLRAARIYGYDTVEELMAEVRPLEAYADQGQREELMAQLRRTGKVNSMDAEFRLRDGSLLSMNFSAVLNEEQGYIESVLLDLTPLRRAESEIKAQRNFLQALLDAMPTPFFYKTTDGRYRLLNHAFENMMGESSGALLAKNVYDVAPQDLADTYHSMDKALFDSRGPAIQRYESQVQTPEGLRFVVFTKQSVFSAKQENLGLVGVVTDITSIKEAKQKLRQAEERFRTIFMNAAEGIFISTPAGRFLDVNSACARILGYGSPEEMLNEVQNIEKQLYVNPEQRLVLLERLERDGVVNGQEVLIRRKDGSQIWVAISLHGVRDQNGQLVQLQGLATDVSERKRFEEELRYLATTDSLTDLPNRARFETALERMLALAKRSEVKFAVMYIDLDGFKRINDTHGHNAGDSLLVQVAERMRSRLRDADLAARIGGDEFAFLLWNVSDQSSAEAVGRDLVTTLTQPYSCGGVPCEVGASIGVAMFPGDGDSFRVLMARADKAMYAVKDRGKSGLAFASDVGDEPGGEATDAPPV